MKSLLVSGYRSHELGIFSQNDEKYKIIHAFLTRELIQCIENDYEWIVSAGQSGIELWAIEVALELKEYFPNLKVAMLPPFHENQENWSDDRKEKYELLTFEVDHFQYISDKPYEAPWQLRNKNIFLTSRTQGLFLLYDEEKEGSPKFLYEEAKKKRENGDYEIFSRDFQDMQDFYQQVLDAME